jgi:hypothetical protein
MAMNVRQARQIIGMYDGVPSRYSDQAAIVKMGTLRGGINTPRGIVSVDDSYCKNRCSNQVFAFAKRLYKEAESVAKEDDEASWAAVREIREDRESLVFGSDGKLTSKVLELFYTEESD